MNILFLNASRKKGNIAILLSAMFKKAVSLGHECELVNITDTHVVPCHSCMLCRIKGHCFMPEDDSQIMLSKLSKCDVFVVGVPTYFGNMPGTLKVMFDRMIYGMVKEDGSSGRFTPLMKGKRAVIINTSNIFYPCTIFNKHTSGCVNSLKEIFRMSGIKVEKVYERSKIDKYPVNNLDLKKVTRIMEKL